jgi:non-specific serine/threonine protein kinase
LVDQSLVQQQAVRDDSTGDVEPRFRLLYVIREYAFEHLEASNNGTGEVDALRRAHLTHYLALVEGQEAALYGPEPAAWLARLEREHDNLRAALAWARDKGEYELGLRLANSLGPFWDIKGYLTEGRGWLESLLAGSTAARKIRGKAQGDSSRKKPGLPETVRAEALLGVGVFAWRQGEHDRARQRLEEGLAMGQDWRTSWVGMGQLHIRGGMALYLLGDIASDWDELGRAAAYFEEAAVQRLRSAGKDVLGAAYLGALGRIAAQKGDLDKAATYYGRSLTQARRDGADVVVGAVLIGLADVALRHGDLEGAERMGREQLGIWWRLGVRGYLAGSLESLAFTAAAAGQTVQTARLLGAAGALRDMLGAPPGRPWRARTKTVIGAARGALGEEAWQAAYEAGRSLSLEETIAEALGEQADVISKHIG